jgi:branched-chain amino acid transport system permease protein
MIDNTAAGAAVRSGAAALSAPRWALGGLTALVVVVWPLVYPHSFALHIGTLVLLYCIGAASLHLVARMGHISLAHAAFMGIGSYTSVLLVMRLGWPFALSLPAAAGSAGLLGLAIGPVLLRLSGKYFVLVTFLFGEIVRMVFSEWRDLTGGSNGIFNIPKPYPIFESPVAYYYLALGAMALCVGLCLRLVRSEIGRTMDALREGEQLTECSGVPVLRIKVTVFVIACAMVGIQGALQSHFVHFISPESFNIFESLKFVVMNVIGGLTNLLGPLLGALFLVLLPELLRDYVNLQRVIYGIILIVVMAFLPGGLVELGGRLRAGGARLLGRGEG